MDANGAVGIVRGWEIVVVGSGAMGSAVARELAGRGRSVLVLERFDRGHVRGSSHGGSRIFRYAYTDPLYVRLARASLDGWRALEADAGCDLLDITGGIDHGDPDAIDALVDALVEAGVDHELLAPEAAAELWPGMRFEGPVLHQPGAGRCRSDAAVDALQRRAIELGADVRFGMQALSVSTGGEGVEVRVGAEVLRADVAVVTAGAWVAGLLGGRVDLPPMEVTEEPVFHFRPVAGEPEPADWPSFVHHFDGFRYGLGTPGEGVKVADHHTGPAVDPDLRRFEVPRGAREDVEAYVRRWLPGLVPEAATATTCLYTSTPTEDFVVDRAGPIVVGSPCSGHGFKFTPVMGRLLADLAEGHPPEIDRFTLASHARGGPPVHRHR